MIDISMIDIPPINISPITSFPPIDIGGYKHFTPTGLITTGFNQLRSDDMFIGTGVNPCHINAGKMGKKTPNPIFFVQKQQKTKIKSLHLPLKSRKYNVKPNFKKALIFV